MKRILFIFILFSTYAFGQNQQAGVQGIARVLPDKVILRWAPNTALAWELGNRHGYIINRYTVYRNNILDTARVLEEKLLTPIPIKPWEYDAWEEIVQQDEYAPIAAQALYGDQFEVSQPQSNPMAFVNQNTERDNRFGFALLSADHSPTTATALGLRFEDTTIRKGEKYLYRIYISENHASYPVDTAAVFVDSEEIVQLPPPREIKAIFGDQTVQLSWEILFDQDIYVSYLIEKSENGETFEKVNSMPFINATQGKEKRRMYFMDSLAQNHKYFYYRIKGLTPFGETGPPSKIASGMGSASLKGATAAIDTAEILPDGAVRFQWSFPEAMQPYVIGYEVARSPSARGPYENISGNLLPVSDSLFTDHKPLLTAYYVVRALGQDSTYTTSFPVLMQKEDDQPPLSPSGLQGTITDNGNVLLEWEQNQEDDLLGYRIFRANSQEEEFIQITGEATADNNFSDSINLATLNEYIYYKVVALDHHFNASGYSEVLEIKKPDVVAPVPALFSNVQAVNGSIALSWLSSPSKDVAAYLLLRMEEKNSIYQVIAEFAHDDSIYHYSDTQIEYGSIYRYLLRTKDDAGLTADNASVSVKAIDEKIMPPVSEISFDVSREKHLVNLHWNYPTTKHLKGFKIYRAASADRQLRMYKYLPSSVSSYTDKVLQINSKYRYAIQAVFDNDAESRLSEEVLVSY